MGQTRGYKYHSALSRVTGKLKVFMLLHQRIDYSPPVPGQNLYVRIPLTSTLWTVIESREPNSERHQSPAFPSRIVRPDKTNSVVFTGVDLSDQLRTDMGMEYRFLWRTVADPDDIDPKSLIALPLGRYVTLTYSHGNASLLSLSLGGVDVQLEYNIDARLLSTSWFTPPFSTAWSLEMPRRIMSRLINSAWRTANRPEITAPHEEVAEDVSPRIEIQRAPCGELLFTALKAVCCPKP